MSRLSCPSANATGGRPLACAPRARVPRMRAARPGRLKMSIMIGALAACSLVSAQQAAQEPDLAASASELIPPTGLAEPGVLSEPVALPESVALPELVALPEPVEQFEPSAADRLRHDAVQSAAVPVPKPLPPVKLSRDERTLARHIAGTYRVANESIERFVHYSFKAASEFRLDPHLILAVMAVESGFNPDAQSSAGAQGLMQVHTRVHTSKFEPFGGPEAAYDPMANIKVGARILSEYVKRYGTVAAGLKAYVGAALHDTDGGYGSKVMSRQAEFDRAVRARSGGTRQAAADESAGRSSTVDVGAMVDRVGTSIGL